MLNRFFQQSSQPSETSKFSTFIFAANSVALVLKTRTETATFLLRTTRSHLNIAWSKFGKVSCLNRWRFELLPFFVALKILSLFFSQVYKVFFGITYFAATCDFVFPSSTSFNALHLSLMDFVFNLRLLAIVTMMMNQQESTRINKNPVNNFLQIKTFIQRNILVFWKSYDTIPLHNFVRQKESIVERLHVVYWYIRFQDDSRNNLLARWTSNRLECHFGSRNFFKGHHVYKDIWTPKQGEQLDVLMEPDFYQYLTSCTVMCTQALGQKLLVKGVILAIERECKSLADWVYLGSQNLYLFYVKNWWK